MLLNSDFSLRFESIFKTNYKRFFVFAFNLVEDDETAKVIVNDAFCELWEQREKYNVTDEAILALLYKIIRSRCIDYIRHQQVVQNYKAYQFLEPLTEMESESYKEYEERLNRVMTAVEELSPQTRRIFEACFFQDKSYKEVADIYSISPNTVRNHIVSALKHIREKSLIWVLWSIL